MPGIAKSTAQEVTLTLHDQPYTYVHLQLVVLLNPSQHQATARMTRTAFDEITLRQYLNAALRQSFGVTGEATSIDILKVEDREAWLRVQRPDGDLLVAALSQWCSFNRGHTLRVLGRATWLGGLEKGITTGTGKGDLWSLEK